MKLSTKVKRKFRKHHIILKYIGIQSLVYGLTFAVSDLKVALISTMYSSVFNAVFYILLDKEPKENE